MAKKSKQNHTTTSDVDGFLREIDEEVRLDYLKNMARKYGWKLLSVLIVMGFVGFGWWSYKNTITLEQKRKGVQLTQIVAQKDKTLQQETLLVLLQDTDKDDVYHILAQFLLANSYSQDNKTEESYRIYEDIANNTEFETSASYLKTFAKIKPYYAQIKTISYEHMKEKIIAYTQDSSNELRFSAAEILAWSAYHAKNYKKALDWSDFILTHKNQTTQSMSIRAEILKTVLSAYISNTMSSEKSSQ